MPPLLLASASPRRRQFLLEMGFDFRVLRVHNVVEKRREDEAPESFAVRLAREKARAAAGSVPGTVVLAADTVVVVGDEVLGKPSDDADFRRMMALLSGRTHEVITGVAARVVGGETHEVAVRSRVTFHPLTDEQIAWYWASGEPRDKAGGYAVQGRGGAFVASVEGSPSNVVGLPLAETLALLEKAGLRPPWLDPRLRP